MSQVRIDEDIAHVKRLCGGERLSKIRARVAGNLRTLRRAGAMRGAV